MSRMMFYERPVALHRDRHHALKLGLAADHYRFAARTNALPIAGSEIAEAARDYPVVFVGEPAADLSVAALVGLRDTENLMVDAQGRWAPGCYVPAFARRYPFVLAQTDGGERLTVCIDEVYPGLGASDGEPLFHVDRSETPYLRRVIAFLQAFHQDVQRASAFAAQLKALNLLVPKTIQLQRLDQPAQTLRGLWIVDAARLQALADAEVLALFRSGAMAWIQAHLISLGALPRLVQRLEPPQSSQQAAAGPSFVDPQPPAVEVSPSSDPPPPGLRH